jgi:leader peptidase (prepilin peptidase)/N-methyltransferase
VFSYLLLRARCRTCGAKIPHRVLLVELGTGLLFALIFQRYGLGISTLFTSIFVSFLIVMMAMDWETQRILNRVSYPALALGLIAIPFSPPSQRLAGGLVGFGLLLSIAILSRGGMGMGDVKLAAFVGLIVGFPEIVLALFIAFVGGGVIVGVLWGMGKVGRKDPIAFGPFLGLGGVVTLIYGEPILLWWIERSWL